MGVVYKLTPTISSFIIDQKRNNARMSCQDLAELVFSKFNQRISKSSVHELLKNAQVIVPRLRRLKPKFQIPPEKKAQLFQTSTPIISDVGAGHALPLQEQTQTTASLQAQAMLPSTVGTDLQSNMGEVFLKAAFYDLSFKPILGLQGYEDIDRVGAGHAPSVQVNIDWEYLTTPVESFKVELEDGTCFYIDARFQGLYDENPQGESMTTPIERTITEMADYVFNNITPLIIRHVGVGSPHPIGSLELTPTGGETPPLQNFISAFENTPGKTINSISLVGANPAAFLQNARSGAGGQMVTEFNQPLKMRRYFIVGADAGAEDLHVGAEHARPVRLKKNDKIIVTNLNPDRCDVWGMYVERHPDIGAQLFMSVGAGRRPARPLDDDQVSGQPNGLPLPMDDNISNQPQWLKDRLKERALMFFPLDLPPAALDEILALPGKTSATSGVEEVHLQIPTGFSYLVHVQKAAALINNLDISKNKKEKLKVFVA